MVMPKTVASAGLIAAFNILDKWGCSAKQIQTILRVSKSAYYNYRKHPEKASLTSDQMERLSYVLNIHAHLKRLFESPTNVYGFMSMENHNPYFNGRRPLDVISTGNLGDLYETYIRVSALGAGLW